jgi:hypothetical protein
MSPNQWGPPIWTLFHTLADKIKEDKFAILKPQIIQVVRRICTNLPCPDCAAHATQFLSKVDFSHIQTKNDFKNLMYAFHNIVNHRKRKELFNISDLNPTYAQSNIIVAFNNFVRVYNTKGNMKLIADSFQRGMLLKELKKWFMINYQNFNG